MKLLLILLISLGLFSVSEAKDVKHAGLEKAKASSKPSHKSGKQVASSGIPHFACSSQRTIKQSDCHTLALLYQQTNGEHWKVEANKAWGATSAPCQWQGVKCKARRVTSLRLASLGLKGQLPDLVGLPYLTTLDVHNNPQLTGPLPALTKLPKLNKLIVFNTGISGFLPDIDNLPNLKHVFAHNTQMIGPIPQVEPLSCFSGFGSDLCLSPQVEYPDSIKNSGRYPLCQPMLVNKLNRRLDVSQFGAIPNDGETDDQAINHAIATLQKTQPKGEDFHNLTLHFPAGIYDLDKSIKLRDFRSVKFVGSQRPKALKPVDKYIEKKLTRENFDPLKFEPVFSLPKKKVLKLPNLVEQHTDSSVLRKTRHFGNNSNRKIRTVQEGALLDLRYGKELSIRRLHFEGQLTDKIEPHLWWDNGVFLGSVNHTRITQNRFSHFGDSALTIATDPKETRKGIQSRHHWVKDNHFYNITQTSTTSEGGGSQHYQFTDNVAEHVKGSIKFATRKKGASDLIIKNNRITSAGRKHGLDSNHGLEVEGYQNVLIQGNTLSNGKGVGITIRSSQGIHSQGAYDWGNVKVMNNTVSKYRQGIYVSNLASKKDGKVGTASRIVIKNNRLENMWNGNKQAAIQFVGDNYQRCEAMDNQIIGGKFGLWAEKAPSNMLKHGRNTVKKGTASSFKKAP